MTKKEYILKWILPEVGVGLLFTALAVLTGYLRGRGTDVWLQNGVFAYVTAAVTGFGLRQENRKGRLEHDNAKHPLRFYGMFLICGVMACVCSFLPQTGWPYLPVFTCLSLFGNLGVGVTSSCLLLMLSALMSGSGAGVMTMYLVSGLFAAHLFYRVESEKRIGMPMFLSMLCYLVCHAAGVVLTAGDRLSWEFYLVPAANMIISGVLIVVVLKYFFGTVIYEFNNHYLDLNDTENRQLSAYRERDKKGYLQCVHTTHFCVRIAGELGMDVEMLKCAGYYYKLNATPEYAEIADKIPARTQQIMDDYREHPRDIRYGETAVLLLSDRVVAAVLREQALLKEQKPDYDRVIDSVFDDLERQGALAECDLTMGQYTRMRQIFKKEKLYYDFLR